MAKKAKPRRPRSRARPVTRAMFRRFQAETAAVVDALRRECSTNLRRCGELQRDLDELRRKLRSFPAA
jgi:hypothetical protein